VYDRAFRPGAALEMMHGADLHWKQLCLNTQYSPSYHTSLPSQWAMHFIGLNLTGILSNYCHQHICAIHHKFCQSQQRQSIASNQQQNIPYGKHISLPSHFS
jgi:hypothetical protein